MWVFRPARCTLSLTYQRCGVKLRDDVMEEDREVSRPRLQQVDALKGAALAVNLTEGTIDVNVHPVASSTLLRNVS